MGTASPASAAAGAKRIALRHRETGPLPSSPRIRSATPHRRRCPRLSGAPTTSDVADYSELPEPGTRSIERMRRGALPSESLRNHPPIIPRFAGGGAPPSAQGSPPLRSFPDHPHGWHPSSFEGESSPPILPQNAQRMEPSSFEGEPSPRILSPVARRLDRTHFEGEPSPRILSPVARRLDRPHFEGEPSPPIPSPPRHRQRRGRSQGEDAPAILDRRRDEQAPGTPPPCPRSARRRSALKQAAS